MDHIYDSKGIVEVRWVISTPNSDDESFSLPRVKIDGIKIIIFIEIPRTNQGFRGRTETRPSARFY